MNPTFSLILLVMGLVLFVIGGFWFLVATFRVGILWGLACLFIPIVPLIFLFVHWPEARRPFFLQLASFVIILLALLLGAHLPLPSH